MSEYTTVNLPDGTQARFPKDMSPQDIQAVLAKQFPAPKEKADMSIGGRIKDNLVGVDDGVMSTGEKVGTWLNKAGESMTFGLVGDEASAAVADVIPGGMNYDERLAFERKNEAQLERENPYASLGAEVAGGVAGALLPFGTIGTLGRGAKLATRVSASGAAGAGMGGTYGFMEGEGGLDNRLSEAQTGAGWGAAAGVAAPAVGSGVKKVADKFIQFNPRRAAIKQGKAAADLRAQSGGQYDVFEGSDAQFGADAMQRLRDGVKGRLDAAGAPSIPGALGKMPKSGRQIMDSLDQMNAQVQRSAARGENPAVLLKALEDVRKQAGVLGREVNAVNRPTPGAMLAQQAVSEIDSFIDNLSPADMPVGDIDVARRALRKARELWRQSIKTQAVENAIDMSDAYLSGRESGLRNQIKSLLRANKKSKLFNAEEEAVLKKIIGNNMAARGVRAVGDGLGRKMAMGGGFMAGGLEGAAVGAAASEAASAIGESAAMRKAEIARALMASGKLGNLPQTPDSVRRITEALSRRIGAVSPQ